MAKRNPEVLDVTSLPETEHVVRTLLLKDLTVAGSKRNEELLSTLEITKVLRYRYIRVSNHVLWEERRMCTGYFQTELDYFGVKQYPEHYDPWTLEGLPPQLEMEHHAFYTKVDGTEWVDDCHSCSGSGEDRCLNCSGTGYIRNYDGEDEPCYSCSGTGYRRCTTCNGTGRLLRYLQILQSFDTYGGDLPLTENPEFREPFGSYPELDMPEPFFTLREDRPLTEEEIESLIEKDENGFPIRPGDTEIVHYLNREVRKYPRPCRQKAQLSEKPLYIVNFRLGGAEYIARVDPQANNCAYNKNPMQPALKGARKDISSLYKKGQYRDFITEGEKLLSLAKKRGAEAETAPVRKRIASLKRIQTLLYLLVPAAIYLLQQNQDEWLGFFTIYWTTAALIVYYVLSLAAGTFLYAIAASAMWPGPSGGRLKWIACRIAAALGSAAVASFVTMVINTLLAVLFG